MSKKRNTKNEIQTALTIAGSDPSGGAGIQADLKTFAAHGVHGLSVIASITAQNTRGVVGTHDLTPEVVADQLAAVFADKKPDAVKTGMLGNEAVVEAVAGKLKASRVKALVVDPVILSSNGKTLLSPAGVEMLCRRLLPLAELVTPNLKEAEALSGVSIRKPADRLKAARVILKMGVKRVLIKGGHLKGDPEDFYTDGKMSLTLKSPRLTDEDPHGTGCVLSAAIAAGLACGKKTEDAVHVAKAFIGVAIAGGVRSGGGALNVNPLAPLYRNGERLDLMRRMAEAVAVLKRERIGSLIPEVQSNLGMGLQGAHTEADVIGIPGRIVKLGEDIHTLAAPEFGGSRHVAHIVLTLMRHDPAKRAVMNIKYTDALLKICRKLKFKLASFDRADEPKRVREVEGSSLEWGTDHAVREYGSVPDIIYDLGGFGKEEMIRVIAEDLESLVEKILKIHRLHQKSQRK